MGEKLEPNSKIKLRCRRCKKIKPLKEYDRRYFHLKGYDVYCHDCRIEINQIHKEVIEKRCRQCGQVKSISEFMVTASARDGYYKECLECQDENHLRKRERENKDSWDGKFRICYICGLQKPSYEFTKRFFNKSHQGFCHSCDIKAVRQRTEKYEAVREIIGWPIQKQCKQCGRIRLADRFNLDRTKQDGIADKCNTCNTQNRQEWLERVRNNHKKEKISKKSVKECSICHILKPYSMFWKEKSSKDGFADSCIPCSKRRRDDDIRQWALKRKTDKKKGKILTERKCRICGQILPMTMFIKSKFYKQGYSTFCLNCSKQLQKKAEDRWERQRKSQPFEFSFDATVEEQCMMCGKVQPLSDFWKRHGSKDGYAHYCKACTNIKAEKQKERLRQRTISEDKLPKEKQCVQCKVVYPRKDFTRNILTADGLDTYCIHCRREYNKRYYNRPEVKQHMMGYRKKPEIIARHRELAKVRYQRPDVKEKERIYKREYIKRPYVKEKRRLRGEEYRKRPEVIARRKITSHEWYLRKKAKRMVEKMAKK